VTGTSFLLLSGGILHGTTTANLRCSGHGLYLLLYIPVERTAVIFQISGTVTYIFSACIATPQTLQTTSSSLLLSSCPISEGYQCLNFLSASSEYTVIHVFLEFPLEQRLSTARRPHADKANRSFIVLRPILQGPSSRYVH
jgi:hypothetical protein